MKLKTKTRLLRKTWRKWSRYSDRDFENEYLSIKHWSKEL